MHEILDTPKAVTNKIIAFSMLFFAVMPVFSYAQMKEYLKDELKNDLGTESTVEYLHLIGYLDNIYFIELNMAYDSSSWVGILDYTEDSLRFKLEGGYVDEDLIMLEFDITGRQSGIWKIKKDREKFYANWQNNEGSMQKEAILYEELWNPDLEKTYFNLISTYTGKIHNRPYEIGVVQNQMGDFSAYVTDLRESKKINAVVDCHNYSCTRFTLILQDEYKQTDLREISCSLNMENQLQIMIQDITGNTKGAVFQKEKIVKTQLREVMTINYSLAVEYPEVLSIAATKKIAKKYTSIFDKLQLELDSLTLGADFDSRLTFFAFAWFDIQYWDNYYISGKWIIQKSWDEKASSIPINYSIQNNREIDIEKQFKSNFDQEFYFQQFIKNQLKVLPEYRNLLVRYKLQNVEFKHLNFNSMGLVFSTDFDTIFGSFMMYIPYGEVSRYLRKRSELNRLIELLKND